MSYNLSTFKQDVRIGTQRAFRDLFAPIAGLCNLLLRQAHVSAEQKISEARRRHAPH
jgi:hypothetical protein